MLINNISLLKHLLGFELVFLQFLFNIWVLDELRVCTYDALDSIYKMTMNKKSVI